MISAREALKIGKANDHDRWNADDVGARDRLVRRIVVPMGRQSFTASQDDTFFAIGSCFARNVEERLALSGANVLSQRINVNFLGASNARAAGIFNKYTPISMLQELKWASGETEFDTNIFLDTGDGFYDPQLHGQSGKGTVEELTNRREQIKAYFAQAFEADIVVLTPGLIECWFDHETGVYLNTMPEPRILSKQRDRFGFHVLSIDECREAMNEILGILRRHGKTGQRIIVTVSPVPLARTFTSDDIIVANTRSKSTLRVAAGALADSSEGIDYFPSYEAVTLSDPTLAWQADRRHASDLVVGTVIGTFLERYGFPPSDDMETLSGTEPSDNGTPEEALLKNMKATVDKYKRRIVNLETELQHLRSSAGVQS